MRNYAYLILEKLECIYIIWSAYLEYGVLVKTWETTEEQWPGLKSILQWVQGWENTWNARNYLWSQIVMANMTEK